MGLSINYNKTQVLHVGSSKSSDTTLYMQHPLSWSHKIKILGINFLANRDEMREANYNLLLEKLMKWVTTNYFDYESQAALGCGNVGFIGSNAIVG